jgi:PAS domain S-box-containing protein
MEGSMFSLDMRTIFISILLTYLVCSLVIYIIWIQYKERYHGTLHLLFSYLLQTLGFLLLLLRGDVPDWISIIMANTFIFAGIIICFMGLEAYTERKTKQLNNYILLAAFAILHTWFTIIDPSLTARNINISAASLLVFIRSSWLMLYRVPREKISLTHPVGIVFAAFSLLSIANILFFLMEVKVMPVDYFDAGRIDSIMAILYQMLVILLTFSMALMFGKNLILEIKSEEQRSNSSNHEKISEQKRYNEIISHEKNLLRTLIDNLPDPVSVRDREGHFLIINNAYLELLGADNQEDVIGKTLYDFLPPGNTALSDEDEKYIFRYGKKIIDKVETLISSETGFSNSFLTSKIPVFDSHKNAVQLVTISHNITDLKRTENSLRESAVFNKSLIKTIPFGMEIVDENGNIHFHQQFPFRKG